MSTHQSPSLRRPSARAAAIAAGLAVATGGAAATPAFAGSFEQVSRASGPAGDAAFDTYKLPLLVTDDGRYAVYAESDLRQGATPVLRRDIAANTTTRIATIPAGTQLGGIARAGDRVVTIKDNVVVLNDGTLKPIRTLATYPADQLLRAALSGNGKTVAISNGTGTVKVLSADTGATLRTITADAGTTLDLAYNASVSDDGSVIAGERNGTSGFYAKGTAAPVALDNPAALSADGSIATDVGPFPGDRIRVTKTADGSSRDYPAPEATTWNGVAWIAPDGSSLVTAHNAFSLATPAHKLTLATGTWSVFGGAFSKNLAGSLVSPGGATFALSPNGRFAAVRYAGLFSNQLAAVNLSGGDLPGDQEPVTASSYVTIDAPFLYDCSATGTGSLTGLFGRQDAWLPKPLAAAVRITVDGNVVFNKLLTNPFDNTKDPSAFPTAAQRIDVPFPSTTKTITYAAATIDATGKIAVSSETTSPIRQC